MKVLLVNGSSHKNGTTMAAIEETVKIFEEADVDCEVVHLGSEPLRDCVQCNYCHEHGECVFKDDGVNEFVEKARGADGFVFASPVYFAHASGRILTFFLDRVFYSNGHDEVYDAFQYKPGAAICCPRRGGATAALDSLSKYFGIAQMPQAGSTYWNMLHGFDAGDTKRDEEGLQTLRNLARNMVWLMRSREEALRNGVSLPDPETTAVTNFVRRDDDLR